MKLLDSITLFERAVSGSLSLKGPSDEDHVAEDTSEIVTSVELLGGNENEGSKLISLRDKEIENGVASGEIAADALYDSLRNRSYLKSKEITAYIPSRRPNKRAAAFTYRAADDSLVCPTGHCSAGKTRQEGGTLYNFLPRHCRSCLGRDKGPPQNNGRVVISVSYNHKYAVQMPESIRQVAENERKRIERKFGEAKQWHGLGRARYWGKAKVAV